MGTPAAPPDSKHLVITTPGRQYDLVEPNSTVVYLGADDFLKKSVDQIDTYIQNFGTLKTLTIVGHGGSLVVAAAHDAGNTTVISIPDFLEKLKQIQKTTGIKVADRIVFNACETLTDLSPAAVEYLRKSAMELGTEIAGATTDLRYQSGNKSSIVGDAGIALMAVFKPDGSVQRDKLSASWYQKYGFLSPEIGQGEWFHSIRTHLRT